MSEKRHCLVYYPAQNINLKIITDGQNPITDGHFNTKSMHYPDSPIDKVNFNNKIFQIFINYSANMMIWIVLLFSLLTIIVVKRLAPYWLKIDLAQGGHMTIYDGSSSVLKGEIHSNPLIYVQSQWRNRIFLKIAIFVYKNSFMSFMWSF